MKRLLIISAILFCCLPLMSQNKYSTIKGEIVLVIAPPCKEDTSFIEINHNKLEFNECNLENSEFFNTKLKDVDGYESEYLHSKELLNSCYGMCVTDICREETIFDLISKLWSEEKSEIDFEKDIQNYNQNKYTLFVANLFLFLNSRFNNIEC